jgi:transcriptional regulator with GAF, ATPase, and Fis domain
LHENSPRAGKTFVKVHCAALSAGLLESELFGHVKGAFTGAHKDKVGRFELANGGTLFLDEIGDITLETQTKLLRVLQEKTFERVGSSESIQVDVRIIAATNQNLERLMQEGRFRSDLFYRLNVITIHTPPLRDRREDIYELALHFLALYSRRSRKLITQIDDEALEALKAYRWPGNIRELANVIERAVVLADGPTITTQALPPEVLQVPSNGDGSVWPGPRGAELLDELLVPEETWSAMNEQTERDRLVRALAAAAGNKAKAARALGMPRTTFLSKLEKYGLMPKRG